jgi:hypothetical protein
VTGDSVQAGVKTGLYAGWQQHWFRPDEANHGHDVGRDRPRDDHSPRLRQEYLEGDVERLGAAIGDEHCFGRGGEAIHGQTPGDSFTQGSDTGTRRVVRLTAVESGRGRGLDMLRHDERLGRGEVDFIDANRRGF